jgi:hypothetical protein
MQLYIQGKNTLLIRQNKLIIKSLETTILYFYAFNGTA